MPEIRASLSRSIPAPPEAVYRILADYHEGHPGILPRPPFGDLVVEQGGVGAGTVIRFDMTSFGQRRTSRAEITEPEPGILVETAPENGLATTFTVAPSGTGCVVTIDTVWTTPGLRGWIERLMAPSYLRKVYAAELELLTRAAAQPPPPNSTR
jgi:Polyketide cyclase / dehydrase and lipid transport